MPHEAITDLYRTVSYSSPGFLYGDFGVVDGELKDQAHCDHDDRHETER
jgi:hypothetical protein